MWRIAYYDGCVCVGQERIEERRGEEYENDLFTSNGQNVNR